MRVCLIRFQKIPHSCKYLHIFDHTATYQNIFLFKVCTHDYYIFWSDMALKDIWLEFCHSPLFFQALPQNILHHRDWHSREPASQTTEHAQQPGEPPAGPSSLSPLYFLLAFCFLSPAETLVLILLRHRGYLSLSIWLRLSAVCLCRGRRPSKSRKIKEIPLQF